MLTGSHAHAKDDRSFSIHVKQETYQGYTNLITGRADEAAVTSLRFQSALHGSRINLPDKECYSLARM
jgi:hypothetical protein